MLPNSNQPSPQKATLTEQTAHNENGGFCLSKCIHSKTHKMRAVKQIILLIMLILKGLAHILIKKG